MLIASNSVVVNTLAWQVKGCWGHKSPLGCVRNGIQCSWFFNITQTFDMQ